MLNVRTNEAVQLTVLQGDNLVTVMRKETLHAVRVDDWALGKEAAAHATATGKASGASFRSQARGEVRVLNSKARRA